MAAQNKTIGRFILDSIPPAPRGIPQIEVTFDIDSNGILNVSAKDKATGKTQSIRIEASSGLTDAEIERMKNEAQANAEADKKERERIDKLNQADSIIFQTEKQLKEYGDKLPADKKAEIEAALGKLKTAHQAQDIAGIDARTQMGEISVHVKELTVLSKSLRPLPIVKEKDGVKYDEFNDPELRYRMRYVDLVVNDKVKDIFITRTRIIDSIRRFFNESGYLEVETPVLQAIPGGATARPFITHHNALDIPMYLRIADELYLKRLIVGGFEGVYEFSRNFRNEGMDRTQWRA